MTASHADTTLIKLDFISPSENLADVKVHFQHRYYYPQSGNTLSWSSTSYFAALRVFRALGQENTAQTLENRVKELMLETAIVRVCDDVAVTSMERKIKRELLGPELAKYRIQFESQKYQFFPIDVFLCELNAREKGKEYHFPSPEQFLKTAAESLAQFEEPFSREEYLITPQDLKKMYVILTKKGHQHFTVHKEMGNTVRKLEKYIAENAEEKPVSLELVEKQDLPENIENVPLCNGSNPLMKLQIGETVRYLRYHRGVNPFQFLKSRS